MPRLAVWSSLFALICVPVCTLAQSTPAEPVTTIRTTTDLVVVDVTATDAKQNPVHQLGPMDFTILEDGHPQTIKVFEEHAPHASAPMPLMPKLDPGTFTNYTPTPASDALNILLIDKLNTPTNAQMVVRDQVLKYLKQAPAGSRMAIFTLATELKLLQGFTTRPGVLRVLVESKKANPTSSPLMNNPATGDAPGADDQLMESVEGALGNSPGAADILARLQQFEAEQKSFQLQLRARYTLDALNQLARYLSSLPGRKNLIWFSGSFPVTIMPDPELKDRYQNPFAVEASAQEEFRETVDLLARSQVAVYPIDARGLMVEPMLDAANSGQSFARNPTAFANSETEFVRQTFSEQSTMDQMAEATGGKAFKNNNDLSAAIEQAVDSGASFYTLAYAPTNHDWNGHFRKIEVKLDRRGVKLAYRRGYFADDFSAKAHRNPAQDAGTGTTQYSAIRAAMQRGAPDPTQILFTVNVRPRTGAFEPEAAPGNEPAPKSRGPYIRYIVEFRVNPRLLDCTATPDNEHHCMLEFVTYVYGEDGDLLNSQSNGIKVNLSPAQFASALNTIFRYRQQISVPAKGEYFLRVGVRDATNDHVGALELPVAEVAKLRPADELRTAPVTGTQK